jgi:hypothetical protein
MLLYIRQSTSGGGKDFNQLQSARQSELSSAAAQPIATSARRGMSIYISTEIHLDQSVSNSHCVFISPPRAATVLRIPLFS